MLTKQILPFQNVVENGSAIHEFELGPTYHRVILQLGGTALTKAMLSRIVLRLNGKIFYDLTGSQLDIINKYRGIADDAGFISIDFTETQHLAANVAGMNAGAIPTAGGVSSFTCEVKIAGATAPTLVGYAEISEAQALTEQTRILAMIPQSNTFASTGKFPILLPHGPGVDNYIKRCHFFGGSPSELTVKKNGLAIFDQIPVSVAQHLQKERELVPQATHFAYDPVVTGDMARVINFGTAQSMQFELTVGATGVVNTVAEYYARLSQL